jgi:hypothetical protein
MKKPSRNRIVALVIVGTLALILVSIGVLFFVQQQMRIQQQYETLTPQQWVKAMMQMDDFMEFKRRYTAGALSSLRKGGLQNFDVRSQGPSATFEALPYAAKGVMRYTATSPSNPAPTLLGEVHEFFHDEGVAGIAAACAPALFDCSEMDQLILETEQALVPVLKTSQVQGILPKGQCQTEKIKLPENYGNEEMTAVICSYGKDNAASLALTRRGVKEARKTLIDMFPSASLAFRRAMVKLATEE